MSKLDNSAQSVADELQLVIFRLAKEEYGLPITQVQEINRLISVTKLPETPPFMEGIINLRGRIIPIIDLRKCFQLTAEAYTDETRILIAEINSYTVGLVVDAVLEVIRLERAQVEPPPQTCVSGGRYINGIGKYQERLIILLNVDSILTPKEDSILREIKKEL